MPLRRSAATKVMVFQCPCGTRPIRRSPRGQRPLSRTILVLAAVSSINTRRAGSNMPCSRIQRRRARATSGRSCSAARRLFFESNLVARKEAPPRGAAARNLVFAHRRNHLVQRQVRLLLDKTQQKIRVLLQRRDAATPWLGRAAARFAKALDPDNRRAGTDFKLLGRLAPRGAAFDLPNHPHPHVPRIGFRHRSASQKRISADRLSHSPTHENPHDSIEAEHALAPRSGQWLSERLGQPFIIEVIGGGCGNIGTEAVMRAPADGYTLLMVGIYNASNTLYDRLNFNFIRDIAPVAGVFRGPSVLVVNPSVPAKSVSEFIAHAKARTGTHM